jgi:hypothetical protein
MAARKRKPKLVRPKDSLEDAIAKNVELMQIANIQREQIAMYEHMVAMLKENVALLRARTDLQEKTIHNLQFTMAMRNHRNRQHFPS